MVLSRFALVQQVRPNVFWRIGPVASIMSLTLPWVEAGPFVLTSAKGEAEGWTISVPSLREYYGELGQERSGRDLGRVIKWAIERDISILGFVDNPWDVPLWFRHIFADAGIEVIDGVLYAVGAFYQHLRRLAQDCNIIEDEAEVLVIGADSVIGRAFAVLAARDYSRVVISGCSPARLEVVAADIFNETGLPPQICCNLNKTVGLADIIIAARFVRESDLFTIQESVRSGAVVCLLDSYGDSAEVLRPQRADVTFIEGVAVRLPLEVAVDRRYPQGLCDAFAVEAMIYALEGCEALEGCPQKMNLKGRIRGEGIRLHDIEWILSMGRKHGFEVAGNKLAVVRSHGDGS